MAESQTKEAPAPAKPSKTDVLVYMSSSARVPGYSSNCGGKGQVQFGNELSSAARINKDQLAALKKEFSDDKLPFISPDDLIVLSVKEAEKEAEKV